MNEHEVIGYSTADLVAAMGAAGIHCSLDRFRRLAHEIQRRALASRNTGEETIEPEDDLGQFLTREKDSV